MALCWELLCDLLGAAGSNISDSQDMLPNRLCPMLSGWAISNTVPSFYSKFRHASL